MYAEICLKTENVARYRVYHCFNNAWIKSQHQPTRVEH